jgi:hypothetical protein
VPRWLPAIAALALVSAGTAGRLAAIPEVPPPPALEAEGAWLVLTRLPAILGEEEVRRQLATGLTTSFVFEAKASGPQGKIRGLARIDVRYELWDEVYIVTRIDAAGRVARLKLPSGERLEAWWKELRLPALRSERPASLPAKAEVRLRVIPFSQSEQLEAQRWFSQALSAEGSGGAGAVQDVEDQSASLAQVLNVLLATSIGRHALLEYEWSLAIANPRGGKR